jgi:hypothetical protein
MYTFGIKRSPNICVLQVKYSVYVKENQIQGQIAKSTSEWFTKHLKPTSNLLYIYIIIVGCYTLQIYDFFEALISLFPYSSWNVNGFVIVQLLERL